MSLRFIALDTKDVIHLRNGGRDANGQVAEIGQSDGDGNPCRHCLAEIDAGQPMLILAHRPFTRLQPYAELGPIFLCAKDCQRYPETAGIPDLYRDRQMLIRGYDRDERIVYGSGRVIDMIHIEVEARCLFGACDLAFIHVRSSTNNCYHFRLQPA